MKRRFVVFVIAFLLVLVGCVAITSQQSTTIPLDDSPRMGPANAPVTVVEFLDYT
jgi:hypothetical protein